MPYSGYSPTIRMPASRPISWFLKKDEIGATRLFDISDPDREYTWTTAQMQDFIAAVLRGDNIGAITITYRQEDGEDVYRLMDGYQRLVSCFVFVQARSNRVNGRSFNDLSDGEKEQFLDYHVPVNEFYEGPA